MEASTFLEGLATMSGRWSASGMLVHVKPRDALFLSESLEIRMVATILRRADKKAANSNLAKLGGTDEETPTESNRRCPRQREPSSPRFEPRPLFLSGRGSKRGKPTAVRSSRHDTLLARQKRGGAVARLRNHQKSRERNYTSKRTTSVACGKRSYRQTGIFKKQKDSLNGTAIQARTNIIRSSSLRKHGTAGVPRIVRTFADLSRLPIRTHLKVFS